jgi:ATP-binding cassette, subfamily F, member 3
MLFINCSQVGKDFGGNPIFQDVQFEIMDGDRVGLVGENGSGKSTLFKLLLGEESPTKGTITRKRNLTIGYLVQEIPEAQYHQTIFSFVSESTPNLKATACLMGELEAQMSDPQVIEDVQKMENVLLRYSQVQERYEALGGYTLTHQAEAVLSGLGFAEHEYALEIGSLSGGEKKLVNLARILLQKPDLLLLDEPDNHLDLHAKAWLEQYIKGYAGAVLIISHDRHLLDRTVTRVLAMEDGELTAYVGNYSAYVEERQQRLQKQQELYSLQHTEIKRLEQSMHRLKSWAEMNPKFSGRAEYMAKRVEQAKREAVDKPVLTRDTIKVSLDAERSGKKVVEVKGLSQEIEERVLFWPFDLTILYGERVGIVGANGSGKTTLLKTLLGMLPSTTGTTKIGASVVVGYYAQEQESLPFDSTPLDFVRHLKTITEPQAIAFLSRLLFSYADMHTQIRQLSGGEKSRLQLARLMLTEANFLLLDEPTNNLDIASTEVLEEALLQFEGTVLVISHDRYFLDRVTTRTLEIGDDQEVRSYEGNYSYYESVRQ